jgi:hypothetical protein
MTPSVLRVSNRVNCSTRSGRPAPGPPGLVRDRRLASPPWSLVVALLVTAKGNEGRDQWNPDARAYPLITAQQRSNLCHEVPGVAVVVICVASPGI